MFIQKATCISAQATYGHVDLNVVRPFTEGRLTASEPAYSQIPNAVLRRMGKAVRMTVGAVTELMQHCPMPDAIIVGTANGGMQDCIRFLNQIMEYNEGTLTPTNFVQSTPNAIAATIGLNGRNHNYNITHVHRGNAFENALLDAQLFLKENNSAQVLLAGVDEISDYNFNIERLGGWYKNTVPDDFYNNGTEGSLPGEGVAAFLLSNQKENAPAKIVANSTLTTDDMDELLKWVNTFIQTHIADTEGLMFLSGNNGDVRFADATLKIESLLPEADLARFKHFTGEYPTATAVALWLAVQFLEEGYSVPVHFMIRQRQSRYRRCLIYNHYKLQQHSLILAEGL
ncbi:MAG: beta-ketoacyl synthase chain length factor [Bacteroidetes bacterium]|jgi:hypothetical protein|nr:beta-ketoacyl synthase chain length factor [Bacteroidota bacterium]